MNDLRKPLGQNRPTKKSASPSRLPLLVIAGLAVLLVGVIAISLLGTEKETETAVLRLPDPVETPAQPTPTAPTETAQVITPPVDDNPNKRVENGVTILYTDPQQDTATSGDFLSGGASDPSLPLPAERQQMEEGVLISPGGPKLIRVPGSVESSVGQPPEVAHLPEDGALEDSDKGALPVRTSDGRRPMDIYARPWSGVGGKRIAVVIGGLGLSQTGTQRTLDKLPPEITLGFASAGNSLERWMREARKQGHELLVQVPMEPYGYPQVDPGPGTLRLASSADTNLDNLHDAMASITNYTGIANYMGARFMGDETAFSPILEDLAYRGLLFFNDGSSGGQRVGDLVRAKGVPYVEADLVIDTSASAPAIMAQLKALEEVARQRGYAVGTGSALELTVDTVAQWANEAKKNGYEIVGVSALAR